MISPIVRVGDIVKKANNTNFRDGRDWATVYKIGGESSVTGRAQIWLKETNTWVYNTDLVVVERSNYYDDQEVI